MYSSLLDRFTEQSKIILGSSLTGIYLHGSSVMGCFNPAKSDIDIIVVVNDTIRDDIKRKYMDMVTALNEEAPAKGIEMSIVRNDVCDPFVYPTPFELHFSIAHLDRYRNDPVDYINKMKGTDSDLAAHFTIIKHRGKVLSGRPIEETFGEGKREYYFDSIWCDIENAEEDIRDNTMYIILNLARVLAYKQDGLILSKEEGGKWALENLPEKYHQLIKHAMHEYASGTNFGYDEDNAHDYAVYMLGLIKADR